ncbi:hypothetical protein K491DRAFT_602893 [Lophiostoma macrostomum CBS 122681]|uniref:Hepatocellular carcinoma-associated antigen 59-domain-containing protein n=1 Tax=Lophiostoma macrostomum CBS 122681 TaxID=1314788 RepID=A0A6A6T158_9PLEO|nr:hypothetical protein K491DRAFT_602893 [Lophiostoma macrostomum CBS 122681]
MATNEDADTSTPAIRFKRRKLLHPKRAPIPDADAPFDAASPPITPTSVDNLSVQVPSEILDEAAPNLREILRLRKRPQDRYRDAARKAAERRNEIVLREGGAVDGVGAEGVEGARAGNQYSGRFVAQTGQIVDVDDAQMAKFVEARLAEQNHRLYGWPIPKHLEPFVAKLTPAQQSAADTASLSLGSERLDGGLRVPRPDRDGRLAAGMGKLQEVDLGPEAFERNMAKIEEARKRGEGYTPDTAVKASDGKEQPKPGKRRRWQKRRNSEDLRRDLAVEAVLKEAKLNLFEEDAPPSPPAAYTSDAEDAGDAMLEQFRREYLETQESRNRKPAPPPGPKGAKEQPKGPKLGGSRSARAAMQSKLLEEGKKR